MIGKIDNRTGSLASNLELALMEGTKDTNRWPDNDELLSRFLSVKQYRQGRQRRLVFILRKIENQIRSDFSEKISIDSELTIEHIMPQEWQANWPLFNSETKKAPDALDDEAERIQKREQTIHTFGNLTLLTQKLNSSVSNEKFSVKMRAILRHSSLEINKILQKEIEWNEESINNRAHDLYLAASTIWTTPIRIESPIAESEVAIEVVFENTKVQRLKKGAIRVINEDGTIATPTKDALRKITMKLEITPEGNPNTRKWGRIVIDHLERGPRI